MSYLNPLLAFGFDKLASAAVKAGVCGFIIPDLPYDEGEDLRAALAPHGLALIQMVTPVTTPERMAKLCAASAGIRVRRHDDRHDRANRLGSRRGHALSR